MKAKLALAAVGIALLGAGGHAAELNPGDRAPEFSLAGSDGKTHRLSDYKGRTVVVAWFPKAFTGGCTKECKALHQSGDAIRAFDVAYFAASVDTAEENKKFAESLGVDFPILSDPDKKTAEAYGVLAPVGVARRWTFYIDKDGKVAQVDKTISVDTAGADVAAKLSALGVPKK